VFRCGRRLIDDQVVGSTNVYARDKDVFGEHAVRLGSAFAQLQWCGSYFLRTKMSRPGGGVMLVRQRYRYPSRSTRTVSRLVPNARTPKLLIAESVPSRARGSSSGIR
jgi:hypothetical protein